MTEIEYVHEPNDLQCGQAVLAMITKTDVKDVAKELENERETTLKEMKGYLKSKGFFVCVERKQANDKSDLPPLCMLSLETPRCWHWSLFCGGTFYDPEHGILNDFPVCKRKYYWEIKK